MSKIKNLFNSPVLWGIATVAGWLGFFSQYLASESFKLNPAFTFSGYIGYVKVSLLLLVVAVIFSVIFIKITIKWIVRKTYK